jgi:hypothetical protein
MGCSVHKIEDSWKRKGANVVESNKQIVRADRKINANQHLLGL